MPTDAPTAFFSYSRDDSEFALRLAGDLKAAGAGVWIDQLDIEPGQEWDNAIEDAVTQCPRMLLILTAASVKSKKVRNEIALALDEQKTIIPVLYQDCMVPLQLRRIQHIDFRTDYAHGLKALLKTLGAEPQAAENAAAASGTPKEGPTSVSDGSALAQVEDESKQVAAERTRQERERKEAAERALEDERKRAEAEERVEEERRRAAERARLEAKRNLLGPILGVVAAIVVLGAVGAYFMTRKPSVVTPPVNQGSEATPGLTRIPPANVSKSYFIGNWVNVQEATRGIKAVQIAQHDGQAVVLAWGACQPNPCKWGQTKVSFLAPNVSSQEVTEATAVFTTSFDESRLTMRPSANGTLTVDVMTHFTDSSGRSDYSNTEVFRSVSADQWDSRTFN